MFSRFLLPIMWISITLAYFLLAQYIYEGFDAFNLVIVRLGMGWCTLLTDECFEFLYPLSICWYDKKTQQGIYFRSTIGNNSDSLSSWWGKLRYWCNTLQWVLGGPAWKTESWSASSILGCGSWTPTGWKPWMNIWKICENEANWLLVLLIYGNPLGDIDG